MYHGFYPFVFIVVWVASIVNGQADRKYFLNEFLEINQSICFSSLHSESMRKWWHMYLNKS